jgi:hypothetical protein
VVQGPILGLSYQPRMMMTDESVTAGGMRNSKGNELWKKKWPVPIHPAQIQHFKFHLDLGLYPGKRGGNTTSAVAQPSSYITNAWSCTSTPYFPVPWNNLNYYLMQTYFNFCSFIEEKAIPYPIGTLRPIECA